MSDPTPVERPLEPGPGGPPEPERGSGTTAGPRRKGPPLWGVLLVLGLLGVLLVINQQVSTGGQPVAWIEGDLDAALRQAEARRVRVFLYLYEPNDPAHQRNERQLFTQRWAREPLESAVCCRIATRPGDVIGMRYGFEGKPLFLLLDTQGRRLNGIPGALDEREFRTHIGSLVVEYARKKH